MWRRSWDDIWSYVLCLLCLAVVLLVTTVMFADIALYGEGLGILGLGVESTLALPQAYRNYVKKSTRGLNFFMILGWMVGDMYKSVYVFVTAAPVQFLMCGVFQMCTDAFILLQMFVLYAAEPSPFISAVRKFLRVAIPDVLTTSPQRDVAV